MRIVRTDDPVAFLDIAGPLLRRDEAGNHLILGVAATHVAEVATYEFHRGWIALDPEPVAAALWTPPRHLLLGEPSRESAVRPLAQAIAADAPALPGLTGNLPAADHFVRTWTELTGRTARTISRLANYALEEVREVPRAPGAPRPANRGDRNLVVAWMRDFASEAPPQDEIVGAELERFLAGRLEAPDAGYRLWIDESRRPVCLAGFMGPTGSGIRVGPVYTPPEHRGRGYARSLLAELARELFGLGYRACYLASDLENVAANRLYEAVGYRRVGEAEMVSFEDPTEPGSGAGLRAGPG